ncbi:hypothetical protein [Singulisphaera sp. PoT]|uniref:hypothetical protein n=1 Tax=Singulisphaera sp. PoT TaxID=3411797 RepID=UPI003BF467EE
MSTDDKNDPGISEVERPDAILFHSSFKKGDRSIDRTTHVQRQLGPRLGGDQHTCLGPKFGGRVYSRDVGGGWYLATLNPDDTLNFPIDHDFAMRPRYRWEDQPDGTRHGFLMSEDEVDGSKRAETSVDRTRRLQDLEAYRAHNESLRPLRAEWRALASKPASETTEADQARLRELDILLNT